MISWDDLFMSMAYLVAMKSKDEKTHIGAVIVGDNNEVRSVGYNSFVRRLKDNKKDRQKRPEKYYWMEHAERNAIYNATLMGVSLDGCRMYTNGIPCMDCARAVVQSGIREVIVDKTWNDKNSKKWSEHTKRSLKMFSETGVKVRYYKGETLQITKLRDGKDFRPNKMFIEDLNNVERIGNLKNDIKNIEKNGFDVNRAKEMMERLDKMISNDEDQRYIDGFIFDIEQELHNSQFQTVIKEISDLRSGFILAKGNGTKLDEMIEMLNECRMHLKACNYMEAYQIAKRTKLALEGKLEKEDVE